jgi:hypothetical protein
MAPEVFDADKAEEGYTASVDVFSFGVMAAVLLLQLRWSGAEGVWESPAVGGAGTATTAAPAARPTLGRGGRLEVEKLPRRAVLAAAGVLFVWRR